MRDHFDCATANAFITPQHVCALAGGVHSSKAWRSIFSPLEANAVLVGSGETRLLFVAVDLLYFGAELIGALRQKAAAHGIDADHLILSASHTHFAPPAERSKPALGEIDEAYFQFLKDKLSALIDTVMVAPTRPVRLAADREITNAGVYRRRRWLLPTLTRQGLRLPPSIVMAPATGAIDQSIDMLRFIDDSGQPVCIIWKLACHPTAFPDDHAVSAEFPGEARKHLRQHLQTAIPVLFWQGFTGDVRPRPPNVTGNSLLQILRRGPSFPAMTMAQWRQWVHGIGDALVGLLSRAPNFVTGGLAVSSSSVPLSLLIDPEQNPGFAGKAMEIRRVKIGETIDILFLGAEVCSPYLDLIGRQAIHVGYTGEVFGYLPSERQAQEGGYEGGDFMPRFNIRGRLKPGFEKIVRDAVRVMPST
jgi:hypothetical protein